MSVKIYFYVWTWVFINSIYVYDGKLLIICFSTIQLVRLSDLSVYII